MLAQGVQGVQGDLLEAIPKLIAIMLTASDALQVRLDMPLAVTGRTKLIPPDLDVNGREDAGGCRAF